MTILEIDLSSAAYSYAVSNSPIYLIRKLKEDNSVVELGHRFSGDDLLAALKVEMSQEPTDLMDFVKPYAYLVALSTKERDAYLRAALEIPNSNKWEWFKYIGLVLLQTYMPTSNVSVQASPVVVAVADVMKTDTPVEYEAIAG